jgi:hypothetical protein
MTFLFGDVVLVPFPFYRVDFPLTICRLYKKIWLRSLARILSLTHLAPHKPPASQK